MIRLKTARLIIREVLRFAFEENNVCRFETGCLVENAPSQRVMQKCGLIREGYFKECQWHDGRLKDRITYRMLKTEWDGHGKSCGQNFRSALDEHETGIIIDRYHLYRQTHQPLMVCQKNIAEITDKAKMLMKKVGISELEKRDITQISGGQLKRAGICRALMASPKIIFDDEPTGALNSKSADEIMGILAEINGDGTAVMLVTHDAKIAARTERILFMCDGKIVSEMQLSKFSGENIDDRMRKITAKMQEIGI